MGKRVHVTQGNTELDQQGEPVEVDGVDVRTLPLPIEPEASATPEQPYVPPKAKPVVVNATLAFGWRRYKVLSKALLAYLDRLGKWAPPFSVDTQEFLEKLASLGQCIEALVDRGSDVRITDASRRASWLRPGARVGLRRDVESAWLAIYPKEVLENVVVEKLVGKSAFLMAGDKVLGLVPVAHLVKPGQRP